MKRTKKTVEILNRYTSLSALLYMLSNRCLTLLNPSNWDDRNDSYYVEQYKNRLKLKTVLAICFTEKRERFHHWRVFGDDGKGICIEFDKKALIESIGKSDEIRVGRVKYETIIKMESSLPQVGEWPFIKRVPYIDEGEFRIIYTSSRKLLPTKDIFFDLSCVRKITLSPWMHKSIAASVTHIIHGIPDCGKIAVRPSTMLENERWKSAIGNAPDSRVSS